MASLVNLCGIRYIYGIPVRYTVYGIYIKSIKLVLVLLLLLLILVLLVLLVLFIIIIIINRRSGIISHTFHGHKTRTRSMQPVRLAPLGGPVVS